MSSYVAPCGVVENTILCGWCFCALFPSEVSQLLVVSIVELLGS
jgi:hypothetical protein